MSDAFDWETLDGQFRRATRLPGTPPGDSGWWLAWHRHLAERLAPDWFYTRGTAPEWFARHWPALAARWVQAGEEALRDPALGEFRPGRLPDGQIDWGANPTASSNWAGFHYWSWANPLMRAYALTGDERFPAGFAGYSRSHFEQLDTFQPQLWEGVDPGERDWRDWVVFNDLSAGIKMATFAEAVAVFRRAAAWTAEDLRRATLLLVRLAQRLYRAYAGAHLPADFLRSLNFLTSGAAGLGAVAALFPECEWSDDWMGLARRILEVHLGELYYPDGGHRELSTQYHKTGLRDILFLEQILRPQGRTLFLDRQPYRAQIRRALLWLARILMPDGTTAVLNSAAASDDWLVFCAVANRSLGDPELAWHVNRWFGPEYVPRQKPRPALCARILGDGDGPRPEIAARQPAELCALLPDSGVAVLRDGWDRWASTMVLDFGRPVGGHAYPARGSFSLYLRGRPAALSPGSPHAYTDPDYRGWMHTSRSQNAVLIDAVDQEEWEQPGVRRVHGEIRRWEVGAGTALVQGRHPGYLSRLGILCTRTVLMVGGRFFLVWDVVDATRAAADHLARWSIQCPEPVVEGAARVGVAAGLMRVVPAWPERIGAVQTGSEGRAVWPAATPDGTLAELRRLHQARWCSPVPAGGRQEFLMLLQSDGEPARFGAVGGDGDALAVEVAMGGLQEVFRLPRETAT